MSANAMNNGFTMLSKAIAIQSTPQTGPFTRVSRPSSKRTIAAADSSTVFKSDLISPTKFSSAVVAPTYLVWPT